jgi:hypothetical protein
MRDQKKPNSKDLNFNQSQKLKQILSLRCKYKSEISLQTFFKTFIIVCSVSKSVKNNNSNLITIISQYLRFKLQSGTLFTY